MDFLQPFAHNFDCNKSNLRKSIVKNLSFDLVSVSLLGSFHSRVPGLLSGSTYARLFLSGLTGVL